MNKNKLLFEKEFLIHYATIKNVLLLVYLNYFQ